MSIWLKRLSVVGLACIPIAVLITRFNLVSFKVSGLLIALSLVLALLILIIGLVMFFKQRNNDPSNAKHAKAAILFSLIPILGLVLLVVSTRDIPRIHNITTDTQDPPTFDKIHDLRSSEHNPLEYKHEEIASLQQSAYPNIKTLVVSMSQAQAHDKALQVIDKLDWELIHDNPGQGIIEANETTALWGFTDDIVIRLRSNPRDDQVEIDLRSVSRVGMSDMGANAERIESFLNAFKTEQ